MKARIQMVIETGTAGPVTVELATIHRAALSAATLGLQLADAKSILGQLQKTLVETQAAEAIDAARVCPQCQSPLHCKGHHDIVYRTVFGKLTLRSPRLYQCNCHIGDEAAPRSFSPLAEVLPSRTSPELEYLQTRFAALMSYGLTLKVLDEILPLGQTLAVDSIRRSVQRVSQRIEAQTAKPPSGSTAPIIPPPTPVKAIGIDGGYVRASDAATPQEGWFEVIVGKSARDDGAGRCFGYVHRLEPAPEKRMQRFLNEEGIQPEQPVIFVSDGGETVRQAQAGFGANREYVLDWFHIGMRFQNLTQLAKGLEESDDSPKREAILKDIERAKWHLWHGCAHRAMQGFDSLGWDVDAMPDCEAKTKLGAKLDESMTYFDNNRNYIVDYGDRFRHGEPIASSFVESAVNQIVAKRFVKKQQMRWADKNAHQLLQVRTAVLNNELRRHFENWYPGIAANDACAAKAA